MEKSKVEREVAFNDGVFVKAQVKMAFVKEILYFERRRGRCGLLFELARELAEQCRQRRQLAGGTSWAREGGSRSTAPSSRGCPIWCRLSGSA